MFEIDYKSIKKGAKAFNFVLVIGILFIAIAAVIFWITINKKSSLNREVKADYIEVDTYLDDDGDTMYKPTYYYTVGDKQYSCKSSTSSTKAPKSSGVVYYEKGNPSNCLTDYDDGSILFIVIFGIVGVILIIPSIITKVKTKKTIKKIKYLETNGKLIKGIPYRTEATGNVINGVPIQRIVLNYTLPNGMTKEFKSEAKFDYTRDNKDDLADLLIDENDPDNYYIDYDIAYSGNAKVEIYDNPNKENVNNQEVDPNIAKAQETVEKVAEVAQSVERTVDMVHNVLGSGSITISNHDDDNKTV